jgi:Nuclease-related domain
LCFSEILGSSFVVDTDGSLHSGLHLLRLATWLASDLQDVVMLTTLHWLLLASLFIPTLSLVGVVWILRGMRSLAQERPPVSDKLLRSPGESLRRELERIDDQINDILVLTVFGPVLFTAIFVIVNGGMKPSGFPVAPAIVFITTVAMGFVLLVWRLTFLIARRRNYRLGFAGERAVAEELNQLMLDGCRVFHDVPMEPYGNIDHVLVSPTGIYAVETKARQKKKGADGKARSRGRVRRQSASVSLRGRFALGGSSETTS